MNGKSNILSDSELSQIKHTAFGLGGAAGAVVAMVVMGLGVTVETRPAPPPVEAPSEAPQIVKQYPGVTVARIPTFPAEGERRDCTITIDHRQRAWSVRC